MCLVQVKDLHIIIKGKKILSDINLEISQGKITSIIGPNGSGKSTLLKTLCRSIRPAKGAVNLNGKNIKSMKIKDFAREVAFLTQHHEGPGDITVKELVEYGRYAHREWWKGNNREDVEIVEWALTKTNLTYFSERTVGTLSGGEQQKAWIAMALAQKPKLLILDEPTSYLDICHQLEVLELVKRLNRDEDITVIMVLHDINQAARFSDELIVLKDGKVFTRGKPLEVINTDNLREVFRVETEISYDNSGSKPIFYPKSVV